MLGNMFGKYEVSRTYFLPPLSILPQSKSKYMKKTKILLLFVLFSLFLACKKQATVTPPAPDNYSLITPPNGWTKSTNLSTGFPKTAAVFELTTPYRAFACVYDLNDTSLVLRTAVDFNRQTPTNWLNKLSLEGKRVLMVANGGYFDLTNGNSYSLVIDSNKIWSMNIRALSRNLNGTATTYYPTRGAFGIVQNTPSVGWVFNTSGTTNYIYPSPSPNVLNTTPQPIPTPSFPSGGSIWNPSVAIGGSPVLVYKNNVYVSDIAEMIDVNNTSGRSRTAIGYTADKRIVFLVIEKSSASSGATLAQTAQLMKDWGCTDALNLDGGGSTCMLTWGNQSTNTPEAGAQRAVTSVVYLMKK